MKNAPQAVGRFLLGFRLTGSGFRIWRFSSYRTDENGFSEIRAISLVSSFRAKPRNLCCIPLPYPLCLSAYMKHRIPIQRDTVFPVSRLRKSAPTEHPLEEGARRRRRIECPAGAQLCVMVSIPSAQMFLSAISCAVLTILLNSASSRQSILCPSGTSFSKEVRVLRYFQKFRGALLFMRRTTNLNPEPINLNPK